MKYMLYIILFTLLISCREHRSQPVKIDREIETKDISKPKELDKLKSLLALPKDSTMEYFDLSNDSITDFPDLSGYTIKTLDLSFNMLDTLIGERLPKKIERLIMSHNNLKKKFWAFKSYSSSLKEIDVSFNHIERISLSDPIYKLIASHNALIYVNFNHKNIRYLDISFNPQLSNKVAFDPSRIDTIFRQGIANDEPLRYHGYHSSGFDIAVISNQGKSHESTTPSFLFLAAQCQRRI